tara:strand:- start:2525 stop:3037 length:513 start_codon:yes stop_codon:yes gene_type:complete
LNPHIKKFKVEDFKKHQENLINLINKTASKSLIENNQKILATDWQIISENVKRDYVQYFIFNILNKLSPLYGKEFNCEKIELINIWFQIYGKGGFHGKHRHSNAHFSNVLFLKLPEKNLKTKIYDLNNSIIETDINEGDIITFPAYLKHESLINIYDENKIIISYNINIV